jgi:hypothetical protein
MPVSEADVRAATRRFLGEIQQIPPMVSARKVGGRRLHELAREGKEVEREARTVRIDRFDVEAFTPGPYPDAEVVVQCSSGTYIRSLALDVGAALGGPATSRRCGGSGSARSRSRSTPARRDRGGSREAPADPGGGDARPGAGVVDAESPGRSRTARCSRRAPFAVEGPGPYAVVDDRGRCSRSTSAGARRCKPRGRAAPADADRG